MEESSFIKLKPQSIPKCIKFQEDEEIENLKIARKFNEYFDNSMDDMVDQIPKDSEIYPG